MYWASHLKPEINKRSDYLCHATQGTHPNATKYSEHFSSKKIKGKHVQPSDSRITSD